MKLNSTFVALIWISLSSSNFVYGLICPDADIIAPCTCFEDAIDCSGPQVTQEAINGAFNMIRQYNSILPHENLTLSEFVIIDTGMEELDLTPLVNLTCPVVYILLNWQLTRIVGPGWHYEGSIDVQELNLNDNRLADEGLGESLKYFAPSLKKLNLYGNSLKGKNELEFFSGLSDLTELEFLDLGYNEINMISNATFQNNNQIYTFRLYNNKVNLEIGENAFVFRDGSTSNLELILSTCGLNDSSINLKDSGLVELNRTIFLHLNNNNFEFISAENFEMLLKATESNIIDLKDNALICDERMKWLHDQKDQFQHQVRNANCANDPGFDVFTTSLIN